MNQPSLLQRSDQELLWFQRRSFLHSAAAWTALGGWGAAQAQSRGNVVELNGDVLVNGARLLPQQAVQTGDQISTGPGATLIFVLGNSAFHVRQNSNLKIERGASLYAVSLLRLLTGAVVSVWGKGSNRHVITPTLTAGIRGTGAYAEVFPNQGGRSYYCNCYGTVDMAAGGDKTVSVADYHQAFWGEIAPKGGRMLTPAKLINHTDEELEFLARLTDQRTAWQIAGKKGVKDGMGYLEEKPDAMHPAQMIGK
ncbi:MAG: FecR family protein [Rhodoferax sp.]|nr:FecR family protein [Rhodoferax sp.]